MRIFGVRTVRSGGNGLGHTSLTQQVLGPVDVDGQQLIAIPLSLDVCHSYIIPRPSRL